jgi:opacity protein-like surface antigen
MRKLMVLFLIGLIVLSVSVTRASDLKGRFGLSGQGGVVVPMGDFADENKFNADMGFGFGGSAEYFATNSLAIGGTFRYTINGVGNDAGIDADYKISNYGAFVKYLFPTASNFMPYIRLDMGLYKPKLSASSGSAEASLTFDAKFGFGGGGGVMFQASDNVLAGAEVLFHNAMTNGAKADMDGGEAEMLYDIQFLTIYAGVTFLVGGTK